ncbi:MAG: hypothetical protein DELT_02876 [Desulfovibrio sp.]
MTPEFVISFARQSIELALFIAMPMLLVGLVVGLTVSIFQAATQIQEMTLSFIPKIISIFLALLVAFPWIMDKIIGFTRDIFMNFPNYIRETKRGFTAPFSITRQWRALPTASFPGNPQRFLPTTREFCPTWWESPHARPFQASANTDADSLPLLLRGSTARLKKGRSSRSG